MRKYGAQLMAMATEPAEANEFKEPANATGATGPAPAPVAAPVTAPVAAPVAAPAPTSTSAPAPAPAAVSSATLEFSCCSKCGTRVCVGKTSLASCVCMPCANSLLFGGGAAAL
jgi:hypothetical protein